VIRRKKKELKKARKALARSSLGNDFVSIAALSQINKADYDKAYDILQKGALAVKATMKENYKDMSIDILLGKQKTPIMKVVAEKVEAGRNYVADFVNKQDKINYEEFNKFYKTRLKEDYDL
jgi:hypothetical protein